MFRGYTNNCRLVRGRCPGIFFSHVFNTHRENIPTNQVTRPTPHCAVVSVHAHSFTKHQPNIQQQRPSCTSNIANPTIGSRPPNTAYTRPTATQHRHCPVAQQHPTELQRRRPHTTAAKQRRNRTVGAAPPRHSMAGLPPTWPSPNRSAATATRAG
jgi:hypothetical protein